MEKDHSLALTMEAAASLPPLICPVASETNAHILIGVTGSVAALKLPLLVAELLKIPGVSSFSLFLFICQI